LRRAWPAVLVLFALAFASEIRAGDPSSEILVYRRGKVLGFDKDVGETLHEVIIETWSCDSGKVVKTERVEAYYHLSEDREVITPRTLCDRCQKKFQLEKKDGKWFFLAGEPPAKPAPAPPTAASSGTAPVASQRENEALEELKKKVSAAAHEIKKVDPREIGSAKKRRQIVEDRALQYALEQFKDRREAIDQVAQAIDGLTDLSKNDRYYVLRSFGWQRYMVHDNRSAAVFYQRCTKLIPEFASAHYQYALVLKETKDRENEIVELARALRAKPRVKYAKLLLDVLKLATRVSEKLDDATLERLREGVVDAKAKLEQSPPDNSGAKDVIEKSVGKLLDEKYPQAGSGAAPEPDDDK
jgi:hypothetical protein